MFSLGLLASFLISLTAISASPVPKNRNVKIDQRQDGDLNFRADLENFVILVIPTSSSSSSSSPSPSPSQSDDLLDFLSKAVVPARLHKRKFKHAKKNIRNAGKTVSDNEQFIESKTAPYHVDISRSRNHLSKLHPETIKPEETLIANSPQISLLKPTGRISKAFILTVPYEEPEILDAEKKPDKSQVSEEKKPTVQSDDAKKDAEKHPMALKLLGAENEQCGPGLIRDPQGICRVVVAN